MSMAAVTKHLGLGATYSTTYYEPFHVARLFQTVDLMTKGRAAWNVVTSVNDNEAKNMGREVHTAHDLRYDEADEFMEIVLGHWDSWDDDAIVVDKKNNVYAHPDKVRRIDFEGEVHVFEGTVHGAADAARPSRRHPGRHEPAGPGVRRTLG